jgi:hypothetical protein
MLIRGSRYFSRFPKEFIGLISSSQTPRSDTVAGSFDDPLHSRGTISLRRSFMAAQPFRRSQDFSINEFH